MPKVKRWKVISRRWMQSRKDISELTRLARATLAQSPEEFIERHHLDEAIRIARRLATEHFGDRFTTFRCVLHVEDWYQHLEVEIGTSVKRADFLEMRRAYLDAFEVAYPNTDWDVLQISVH